MKFLSRFFDLSELNNTVRRFSLPLGLSILVFLTLLTSVTNFIDWNNDLMWSLVLFFMGVMIWSVSVSTFQESMGLSKIKYRRILLSGLVVYEILLILVLQDNPNFQIMMRHFIVANLMILCDLPFVFKRKDDLSVWEYNRRCTNAVINAFFATLILQIGLGILMSIIDGLFDVGMSQKIFWVFFCFAFFLLFPFIALSKIPEKFVYQDEDVKRSQAVQSWLKNIFIPFEFIAIFILYLYFTKIIIQWDMPEGKLAGSILFVYGIGLALYWLAWPFYKNGTNKIFALFQKSFFPLMILPAIVLCMALYVRIDQYGVTPERFYLGLFAAHALILSCIMSAYRADLRTLSITAAILILLTSTPLFNARMISLHSQQSILRDSLMKYGLLENGNIIPVDDKTEISYEDQKRISGAYDYLTGQWSKPEIYGYTDRQALFNDLGFDHLSEYDIRKAQDSLDNYRFQYEVKDSEYENAIALSNYDYADDNITIHDDIDRYDAKNSDDDVIEIETELYGGQNLIISIDGSEVEIPLEPMVFELLQNKPLYGKLSDPIVIEGKSDKYAIKIIARELKAEFEGDTLRVERIKGFLLVRVK